MRIRLHIDVCTNSVVRRRPTHDSWMTTTRARRACQKPGKHPAQLPTHSSFLPLSAQHQRQSLYGIGHFFKLAFCSRDSLSENRCALHLRLTAVQRDGSPQDVTSVVAYQPIKLCINCPLVVLYSCDVAKWTRQTSRTLKSQSRLSSVNQ